MTFSRILCFFRGHTPRNYEGLSHWYDLDNGEETMERVRGTMCIRCTEIMTTLPMRERV